MDITAISSGSKGNAYLISDGETTLLLDAGVTFKRIQEAAGYNTGKIAAALVTHRHGDHTAAIPVLICLLSNIYRTDGYYLRWDGDMPYLIADECGAEEGVVTEVLSKAQQVGFFDAEILETYRVLTSRGVQKRYFLAVKNTKRKEIAVVENFLLIDPSDAREEDGHKAIGTQKLYVREGTRAAWEVARRTSGAEIG